MDRLLYVEEIAVVESLVVGRARRLTIFISVFFYLFTYYSVTLRNGQ